MGLFSTKKSRQKVVVINSNNRRQYAVVDKHLAESQLKKEIDTPMVVENKSTIDSLVVQQLNINGIDANDKTDDSWFDRVKKRLKS